jgi:hypothetical protein
MALCGEAALSGARVRFAGSSAIVAARSIARSIERDLPLYEIPDAETGEWAPGCALARRFGRAGGGGEQATRCLPAGTVSGAGRFGGPNLNGKNENKKQTPLRVYNTH